MASRAGTTTSLYGGGAPGRPWGLLPLAMSGGAALGQPSMASHVCSGHLGILLKCQESAFLPSDADAAVQGPHSEYQVPESIRMASQVQQLIASSQGLRRNSTLTAC